MTWIFQEMDKVVLREETCKVFVFVSIGEISLKETSKCPGCLCSGGEGLWHKYLGRFDSLRCGGMTAVYFMDIILVRGDNNQG